MARIDFGDGEGLERIRMWSLQPDVGMAMGAAAKTLYTKISLDVRRRGRPSLLMRPIGAVLPRSVYWYLWC